MKYHYLIYYYFPCVYHYQHEQEVGRERGALQLHIIPLDDPVHHQCCLCWARYILSPIILHISDSLSDHGHPAELREHSLPQVCLGIPVLHPGHVLQQQSTAVCGLPHSGPCKVLQINSW